MSFKTDVASGLSATFAGTDTEQVRAVVHRAVGNLTKNATVGGQSANSTQVVIMPGMSQKMSDRSPIVEVQFGSDGSTISLNTRITHWVVRQNKFLFVIPSGPKRLSGASMHRKFLNALEVELRAVEPNVQITRR